MAWMFLSCKSLKSLDLSSFDTRSVTDFQQMFFNSSSLITLNLSNFNISQAFSIYRMFRDCNNLESLDISNFNPSSVNNFKELFRGCTSLKSIHFSQFILSNEENYFEEMLTTFNERFIICFNESNRNGTSSNCSIFQNLYNYFGGRIICRNCSKDNYLIKYNHLCNDPCLKGTLFHKNSLCFRECHFYELFFYLCDIDNINNDNNYLNKDELTEKLEKNIREGLFNSLLSNVIDKEKQDIIIQNEDVVYQITSTENQKNNKNNNISKIELGDCENALRTYYSISDNEPLYILKVDYFKQDYLIPIIGYEVFHPENKSILDLNQFQKNNIN
jgi:surface protein